MSAQHFLRRVEQMGVVSEPLLAELRKRIEETHRSVRPEMLAKLLVDREELTAAQARKLVTLAAEDEAQGVPLTDANTPLLNTPLLNTQRPKSADPPASPTPSQSTTSHDYDDLTLAPIDEDEPSLFSSPSKTGRPAGPGAAGSKVAPDDLLGDDDLLRDGSHFTQGYADHGDGELRLVGDEDDENDDQELTLAPDASDSSQGPTTGGGSASRSGIPEGVLLDDDDDLLAPDSLTTPPPIPSATSSGRTSATPSGTGAGRTAAGGTTPGAKPATSTQGTKPGTAGNRSGSLAVPTQVGNSGASNSGASNSGKGPGAGPLHDDDAPSRLDDLLDVGTDAGPSRRLGPRRRGLKGFVNELFGGRRPSHSRWDSPLILLGGGGLILLIAAGFLLFGLFFSESADVTFKNAEDAYAAQSYGKAITNFERFADNYPRHEKASLARVRVGLARLRQVVEGGRDWEAALAEATTGLPKIATEVAFGEARSELAKLLPDIAAGLVDQARAAEFADEKKRLVDLASQALVLVNNPTYLPTSVRGAQEMRIDDIEGSRQIVLREIDTDRALRATLQQIQTEADSGKIALAYQHSDKLVDAYPLLAGNSALRDALSAVAKQEREAVVVGPAEGLTPTAKEASDVAPTSVALSDARGTAVAELQGHVLGVLVRGAAYGLDAESGGVLWRRFVGYDTAVYPQAVDPSLASDFILVDSVRSEVLRVRGTTGELVWRLACPAPIATPQVRGNRLLVTCGGESDSALLLIDAEQGNVLMRATFPVGCVTPTALSGDRDEIVQLGRQSSVYVLDPNSLRCKTVIPVGHARNSVQTSPVALGNLVVVAENNGADSATLHVFQLGADGVSTRLNMPLRLRGQVVSPMVTEERRLLVSTDLGELHVFEVPLDQPILREIASKATGNKNIGLSVPLLDRSQVWIADSAFTRYELQATRGELVVKGVSQSGDQFVAPLVRKGNHLFHVRHRAGMSGATISCLNLNASSNDTAVWETNLGVPMTLLSGGSGAIHAVSTSGAYFAIDRNSLTARVAKSQSWVDARLLPTSLTQSFPIAEGRVAFASSPPGKQWVIANPSSSSNPLQLVPLRTGDDELTTELVPWGDGVLAGCDSGPIHWIDLSTGRPLAKPFMPRMEPGSDVAWLPPTPLGRDQFVAAERSGRIYRIGLQGQLLKLLAENKWDAELIAGLASVEDRIFAVILAGSTEQIVSMDRETLTIGTPLPLRGAVTWGPRRVGSSVIVADSQGDVYSLAADGSVRWKVNEGTGNFAGAPVEQGELVIFADQSGLVWLVDAQGHVRSRRRLDEPLGSSPLIRSGQLLVTGLDGTLYFVSSSGN